MAITLLSRFAVCLLAIVGCASPQLKTRESFGREPPARRDDTPLADPRAGASVTQPAQTAPRSSPATPKQARNDTGGLCTEDALPPDKAITRYHLEQKACDGGDEKGCRHLALSYTCGSGVAQDSPRAAQILEKSCERSPESCDAAGVVYFLDPSSRNFEKAQLFFQRGCDGGVASACGNLGTMYMEGTGVPQSSETAMKLSQLACDRGDRGTAFACANLATLYLQGPGVAHDAAKAAALFRVACDHGSLRSCVNLGVFYQNGTGVERDDKKGADIFAKACDSGSAVACDNLGVCYWNGTGVARDEARAKDLMKRACDAGYASACDDLGKLLSP